MPSVIKKIILCAFAILWTLVAAETYLRVFAPEAMLPRFIEEGEHGIRRNIPGERYSHSSVEYRVDFSINRQGIRDPREFEKPKPEDVLRILLLGDSFAMGYGVSYEDSVPARLESALRDLYDRPVEVINLAVSGFGTAEELIALETDGWSFEPDVVMVFWDWSDPRDNIRSQLYELTTAGLIPVNDTYLPAVAIRTWLFSFSSYRWIAEHSQFYNWIRDEVGRTTRAFLFTLNSMRASNFKMASDDSGKVTDANAIPRDIGLSLALLERIQDSCGDHGVGFFIAEVPTNPNPGVFKPSFPYEAMKKSGYAFDVINPIPVFEQFRDSSDGGLIYWQKSAGHWTPLGTSAMAEAIADYLKTVR